MFSAATPDQLRTPADRTAALGQAQALRRDAELRMLEINRRADALETRLATTRTGLATATVTAADEPRPNLRPCAVRVRLALSPRASTPVLKIRWHG